MVRTTATARGTRRPSRRRTAGTREKLRSTDRASGLRTSPVKYRNAITAKIIIVSLNGSAVVGFLRETAMIVILILWYTGGRRGGACGSCAPRRPSSAGG